MQPIWDDLDKRMLRSILQTPGRSIRGVIGPFLKERTETPLRVRVRKLWLFDLIEMKPGVAEINCYPLIKNIRKNRDMQDTLGGVP